MTSLHLSPEEIAVLLQSMALSRGAFLPKGPSIPGRMPPTERNDLAKRVVDFFGLDSVEGNRLVRYAEWSEWACAIAGELPSSGANCVFFRTSGSTGTPCRHALSNAQLSDEVSSLIPFFSTTVRIVSVMPIHHVFGFVFALLLPKALGIASLHLPPLPTADFFNTLRRGDLVLAFPVFWKSLLDIWVNPVSPNLPKGLHGVSSTAPCPPEVIEALLGKGFAPEKHFLASMSEIYGATEFGAVGIRRHCRGPYELLPHWKRCALPGELNNIGRSPWGIRRANSSEQILPDEIQWQDERHFTPSKRKDFAVQVGGLNVFPTEVAELLRSHPNVADCAVRLMRPSEGYRLKAFVVPSLECLSVDACSFIKELKKWCAERLEPAATPKHIRIGTTLPLTAAGKLADWDIEGA